MGGFGGIISGAKEVGGAVGIGGGRITGFEAVGGGRGFTDAEVAGIAGGGGVASFVEFGGSGLERDADVVEGGSSGRDTLFVGSAKGVADRALAEIAVGIAAKTLTDIGAR